MRSSGKRVRPESKSPCRPRRFFRSRPSLYASSRNDRSPSPSPQLPLLGHLRAHALLRLLELGSEGGAEVRRLEHLANLDLGLRAREGIGAAPHPFDRLLLRLHLNQPEPGDQLLRLGEGPVDDAPLPSGEPDARALRARVQPFGREQHAGFHQLLVVLPHLGQKLLVRENPRLRALVGLDQHHESHRRASLCEPWLYHYVEPGSAGSTRRAIFFASTAGGAFEDAFTSLVP